MIIRVFRGRVKPGMLRSFAQLTRECGIPYFRDEPGLLAVRAGQPPNAPDVYCVVSVWKDLDALRSFAGERWQEVVILPGEAELLIEASVAHYDDSYERLRSLCLISASALHVRETLARNAPPLSAAQWERMRALLPPGKKEGRPRADDRATLAGILYVLRNGLRWQDLPPEYGSPVTCWRRLRQWEQDGTWQRVWRAYFGTLTTREKVGWARLFIAGSVAPTKARKRRAG